MRSHVKQILILFVLYFVAARIGLAIGVLNDFAALMWPPAGIAVAALIIFGPRLWPGVFLGALLVNWITGAPFLVAVGIATGNTLEALAAGFMCSSARPFDCSLQRRGDVLRLLFFGGVISSLISATIGAASLYAGAEITAEQLTYTWTQWWAGDALGILAIAPLILVFKKGAVRQLDWFRAAPVQWLLFITVLSVFSFFTLGGHWLVATIIGFQGVYLLLPILLWAAMRFGQRGSVLANLIITTVAIWYTSHGVGPFAGGSYNANLFHLLMFVVTFSVTTLFVGSVVAEREMERENLQRRKDEIKQAKEQADAANSAKSSFLANMSHEIRTPLGAVLGFSELMAEPTSTPEERANYSAVILRNGELLLGLVNDVLDLSKIEAGKLETSLHETSIREIIADVTSLLGLQARTKGVALTMEVGTEVPRTLQTDSLRLRQILINVIGNAVKFTAHGSVHVKAYIENGNQLLIAVTDSGGGIDAVLAKRLFAPFSQGDTSPKRKYGGAGLGLVLARRLANLLGGDVVLTRSSVNVGSTFTITVDTGLPAINAKPARLDGLKILLAEDSMDNRYLIMKILNGAGASVQTANNGQQAMQMAFDSDFDLLLMDLQMPVMDGYEATKTLRGRGYSGKIVALTAHALDEDRKRCLAGGFDAHLSKPVHRESLVAGIAEYLYL